MTAVLAFLRRWWRWLAASFVVAGVVQAVRNVLQARNERLEAEARAELLQAMDEASRKRIEAHDAKVDAVTEAALERDAAASAAIAAESDQEAAAKAKERIAEARKERSRR